MNLYRHSVGRNAVLLLDDVPPACRGQSAAPDVEWLAEFCRVLRDV